MHYGPRPAHHIFLFSVRYKEDNAADERHPQATAISTQSEEEEENEDSEEENKNEQSLRQPHRGQRATAGKTPLRFADCEF